VYTVVLDKLEEDPNGRFGPCIKWFFRVRDEGAAWDDVLMTWTTSMQFGGGGKKISKLEQTLTAFSYNMEFGDELSEEQVMSFIGKCCKAFINDTDSPDGRVFTNIVNLMPLSKGRAPTEADGTARPAPAPAARPAAAPAARAAAPAARPVARPAAAPAPAPAQARPAARPTAAPAARPAAAAAPAARPAVATRPRPAPAPPPEEESVAEEQVVSEEDEFAEFSVDPVGDDVA
jgi:hypothetical protein